MSKAAKPFQSINFLRREWMDRMVQNTREFTVHIGLGVGSSHHFLNIFWFLGCWYWRKVYACQKTTHACDDFFYAWAKTIHACQKTIHACQMILYACQKNIYAWARTLCACQSFLYAWAKTLYACQKTIYTWARIFCGGQGTTLVANLFYEG